MNNEILIYAKYDENNSIVAIRSSIFLNDTEGWSQIDEWQEGQDRYMYAHADNGEYVQEKHGKPLYNESGRPNFHGDFVEWTAEEKEEFYPPTEPEETMETAIANTLTNMIKSKVESETTIDPTSVTLFSLITNENEGTDGAPIELTDNMNILYDGYLYEYGKIYLYKGIKYKCTRTGESDGTFIKLYYYPDALIGHYFVLV